MTEIKKILCAIDHGETSTGIAEYARILAKATNAELFVVYVEPSLDRFEQFNVPMGFREEYEKGIALDAKAKTEKFIKAHFGADKKVRGINLKGDTVRQLMQFIEDNSCDMLVIGSHSSQKFHGLLFGSVAEKMIKLSRVPVLVVKPGT